MYNVLSYKKFINTKTLFHAFIAATGLVSVPLHILFSPDPIVSITKFTIHSNIIVALLFTLSTFILLLKKKESRLLNLLKHASLLYMMLVLLSYHFLLSSGGEYSGIRVITNFTLHYLIPILVLLNWIIFEEKKWQSYTSILYSLIFPVLYCLTSLIRGLYDGFYPYFFLNPNEHIPVGVGSYGNVVLFIVGFTFVFIMLSFLITSIDRGIFKYKNRISYKVKI